MKAIIKEVGKEPKVIDIENTLEAARKTFPQNVIERDYTGIGDIVVWRKSGRGSYVYNIRLQNNKRKDLNV